MKFVLFAQCLELFTVRIEEYQMSKFLSLQQMYAYCTGCVIYNSSLHVALFSVSHSRDDKFVDFILCMAWEYYVVSVKSNLIYLYIFLF
jgi:hypothetical protein